MKAEDYRPIDRAKFDEMLRDARGLERKENLSTFMTCWIFDRSYPRQDISTVLHIVEREKGWRR